MKIRVMSDLHLEFGGMKIQNDQNDDLLILSGDIVVGSLFREERREELAPKEKRHLGWFESFLSEASEKFKTIIMIPGNHEYYTGDISRENDTLRDYLKKYQNIHFLHNESLVVSGIRFIGTPLWTDFNKGNPISMMKIVDMMNDYHLIYDEESVLLGKQTSMKLNPQRILEIHRESVATIAEIYDNCTEASVVVVGHHAPSRRSIHPMYANDIHGNSAYASDLDTFIEERDRIKLWTHGHTHHSFDYNIGTTRVLCNPRGYDGYELNRDFDPNLTVEVV